MRLALIFRRYDSGLKGFIDHSDFIRMTSHIRALGVAWDSEIIGALSESPSSKFAHILSKLRMSHRCPESVIPDRDEKKWDDRGFNNQKNGLDFRSFVDAVDQKLIR